MSALRTERDLLAAAAGLLKAALESHDTTRAALAAAGGEAHATWVQLDEERVAHAHTARRLVRALAEIDGLEVELADLRSERFS